MTRLNLMTQYFLQSRDTTKRSCNFEKKGKRREIDQ